MITHHHNGEQWYVDKRNILKRIRIWFIWVGGWEKPRNLGWRINSSPTPISFFGHRFTIYYTGGIWLQVTLSIGHLTYIHKHKQMYISRDGTPSNAHCWIMGCPEDIKDECEQDHVEAIDRLNKNVYQRGK